MFDIKLQVEVKDQNMVKHLSGIYHRKWLVVKKDDPRGGPPGQTRFILRHKSSKALVGLDF